MRGNMKKLSIKVIGFDLEKVAACADAESVDDRSSVQSRLANDPTWREAA
jgi:hypothetical protein